MLNTLSARRFEDVWVARAEFGKMDARHPDEPAFPPGRLFPTEVRELLNRDPVRAETRARQALIRYPLDPEARFLLGAALRDQHRYAESIDVLGALTQSHPQLGAAWQQLGMARMLVGHADGAVVAFRNAVDFNPVDGRSWYGLGDLLSFPSDLPQRRPEVADAETALRANRVDDAECLLRSLLDRDASDVSALKLLADSLLRGRRWKDAKIVLERCLALAPSFANGRFRYASMLTVHNEYIDALPHIDKLLEADCTNEFYRHLKAIAVGGCLRFDEAITHFETLITDFPDRPGLWNQYVQMVREVRPEDAALIYEEMLRRFPRYVETYYNIATMKSFRFTESWLDGIRAALGREDLSAETSAQLHFVLGKAFEDLKQYSASFGHYRKSNEILRESNSYDPDEQSEFKWRSQSVFTPAFFHARPGAGCKEKGAIFIVGLPRSGSTLIEQILSSHSAVEALAELDDLPVIIDKELQSEPHATAPVYPVSVRNLNPDHLRRLGEQYMARTRLRRRTGKPLFTDKAPFNFTNIGLIHLILPNAKIIDARRHPLDCGFSCYKHYFPSGQPMTKDLRTIGRYYADYIELMAHFDEVLPGRVHRVIYEELVANPEQEIRKLLSYLELPFQERCLRFHETRRFVMTISADQVRMPLYNAAVAHWRHYENWLAPLKEELGYVLDSYPNVPKFFPRLKARCQQYAQGTTNPVRLVNGLRQLPFEHVLTSAQTAGKA